MIVLGVILLLVVALVVAAVLLSTPTVHQLSAFRIVVPVTDAGMFLAGAAATLLAVIAILLIRVGISRSRARHRQVKALSRRSGSETTVTPVSPAKPPKPVESAETGTKTAARPVDQPATDAAERRRLLAEADALTRDDPPR